MTHRSLPIPKPFLWKKLHSLTGLWLVLFLIFHLLTNSQAALFFGDDGVGFIREVNKIHELPFLLVMEIAFLGLPFFIHGAWGVVYAWRARLNSFSTDGRTPSLGDYRENQGFTWQRITSWILLVGVLLHVYHMRILHYPLFAQVGTESSYMVRVTDDPGLSTVAARLGVELYSASEIDRIRETMKRSSQISGSPIEKQTRKEKEKWLQTLKKRPLQANERIAVANNFGTVELLLVRNAFQRPLLMVLYSLFVLAASFHAFNGLWTAMISFGVTLTQRSQRLFRHVCLGLLILIAFLGLVAIWGTYWINLYS